MKKLVIAAALVLLTACTPSSTYVKGEVVSCETISQDSTFTGGVQMDCLDRSEGAQLGALRGPMVVNVWGSWCEGCKQEMPYFVELYENPLFKNGQIQMLGVNVDEKSKEDAIEYIQKSGMSWPNLEDSSGISKSIFGPGVPVTWFIDENGKTVETKIGAYTNRQQLFNQVEKAFGVKL